MHAPPHKHTCCCIQISYESAHTHTKTYIHTRPQAWRARAPADSGQRHLAYIHAIMSNQSSSHTQMSRTFRIQSSHSCLNPHPLAHVQVAIYMLLALLWRYRFLITHLYMYIFTMYIYTCIYSSVNPIHLCASKLWYICMLADFSFFFLTHTYMYTFSDAHLHMFTFKYIHSCVCEHL